jgi:hypothetical protein
VAKSKIVQQYFLLNSFFKFQGINRLREAGTLDHLFKKWWKLNKNSGFDNLRKVSWNDSILAFSSYFAIICIGWTIILIEIVLVRYFHPRMVYVN